MSDEQGSRIIELTREVAGAMGLAELIRKAWTDASPEYRQRLSDKLIESVSANQWELRVFLQPILAEVLQEKGVQDRLKLAIEALLPEIEDHLIAETRKELSLAVRDAIPKALEEIGYAKKRAHR